MLNYDSEFFFTLTSWNETQICLRLKRIFLRSYVPTFTDDASVAEAIGARVHLIPGNDENIKITNPLDLSVAAIILKTWSY
ncbi:2-C-methyl-D-erythritol 4-phosphate cytidylyltransferase [Fluviicola sp.]|uniref:2-C-methyl-D-erythritol 4-phosphate cytidylyltransferase n=1 Tax=Fluviicola sp. TaxID=1917219 RepID=UPI002604546B|nr:2-C-methyl-D-erythritol 4-phosphate cytidylyltransferase [Fluviicola sp.]